MQDKVPWTLFPNESTYAVRVCVCLKLLTGESKHLKYIIVLAALFWHFFLFFFNPERFQKWKRLRHRMQMTGKRLHFSLDLVSQAAASSQKLPLLSTQRPTLCTWGGRRPQSLSLFCMSRSFTWDSLPTLRIQAQMQKTCIMQKQNCPGSTFQEVR